MHITGCYYASFCVYKGKRQLSLLITCANFVLFALYQFWYYFVNIVLENVEKSLQSAVLERVGWGYSKHNFFPHLILNILILAVRL